ncbi:MAG: ABC transporter permease [Thermoproteota archaeon]
MRLQRILAIVRKEFKRTICDPAILFMIFLFPVVFMLAFGLAFGASFGNDKQTFYEVGVINMDQGPASQAFLAALSKTEILLPKIYGDNQTAQNDLSQSRVQVVILIPSDFSSSFASYQAAPNDPHSWVNTTITLYLDKGSLIATQVVPSIVQQILTVSTEQYAQVQNPFRLKVASLVEVKKLSFFEYMAPGMFTFASIYILMMVAQSFVQDRENGMMKRIRMTPITPVEFMIGQMLSYILVALVQAVLVFTTISLLGFRPDVRTPAYVFAFMIILVFSLSNIGFGLITATVSKSSGAATGISSLFLIPQLFLGTFVGMSLSSAAQVACRFVPSYYVTDALISLFLRGADVMSPAILLDFVAVSASCVAILVLGMFLYAKYYRI